jgi:hypothetical protein
MDGAGAARAAVDYIIERRRLAESHAVPAGDHWLRLKTCATG